MFFNIRKTLLTAAVALAAIVGIATIGQQAQACTGNLCQQPTYTTESRFVEVGAQFAGGAIQEGTGSAQTPSHGVVKSHLTTSDGFTDTRMEAVSDISTCPADECAGLRVELNGRMKAHNISSAFQAVEGGSAHAGSQSAVAGELAGSAYVLRGIQD